MGRQIRVNKEGQIVGEWQGMGSGPESPDPDILHLDVTDRPEAQIGCTYDAQTDTFTPPPPVAPQAKRMSKFAFMSLLTMEEYLAMETLATTDAVMRYALKMLDLAEFVEPAHPMVAQMLGYATQKKILTPERHAALFAAMEKA